MKEKVNFSDLNFLLKVAAITSLFTAVVYVAVFLREFFIAL